LEVDPLAIRRRLVLVVFTVLLCFSPATLVSQESTVNGESLPLKAEMTVLFTAGSSALHLSADPSVVWKPGALAVGVGMELLVGMNQFDIYLLPYLRAEIEWFHLDLGYVVALVRPLVGDGLAGPSLGLAIAPKPFEVGYGRMGFDLGLDINLAGFGTVYGTFADATVLERVVVSTILSSRIGLGLTYSFELL
jgi:hypothetical protein